MQLLRAGDYWFGTVKPKERVRIENTYGTQGVCLFMWRHGTPAERLNVADTMKIQGTTRLGQGSGLLSDMGRLLAVLVEDSCGSHDMLVGGSTRKTVSSATKQASMLPNAQDHLRAAAGKLGLTRRDVGPSLMLFSHVDVDPTGNVDLKMDNIRSGMAVTFEAVQDIDLVLSNTVHPYAERAGATPLDIQFSIEAVDDAEAITQGSQLASGELARAFDRISEV